MVVNILVNNKCKLDIIKIDKNVLSIYDDYKEKTLIYISVKNIHRLFWIHNVE